MCHLFPLFLFVPEKTFWKGNEGESLMATWSKANKNLSPCIGMNEHKNEGSATQFFSIVEKKMQQIRSFLSRWALHSAILCA